MADQHEFGRKAEDLAAEFLSKAGYTILCRNYRYLKSEVDIICQTDSETVFVEVKARNTDIFLEPHEAVNKKKIKMLVAAADEFMKDRTQEARFDIISVLPDARGKLQILHIQNAFTAVDAQ